MSHFTQVELQISNTEGLIAALMKCGLRRDQIEVHSEAQPLIDYCGRQTHYRYNDTKDERFKDCDKAHVIVRREHLGSANNDWGMYIDPEKGSVSFLCDFSRTSTQWNDTWLNKVAQHYAAQETVDEYESQGTSCIVQEHENNVYVYAKA